MNQELKQKVKTLSPDDIHHMQQQAAMPIAALSRQFHAYGIWSRIAPDAYYNAAEGGLYFQFQLVLARVLWHGGKKLQVPLEMRDCFQVG